MGEDFLHGIETIEIDNGIRPITTVKSSVIGLIGTAPNADADVFPLNTPVLLTSEPTKAAKLGTDGTLYDAIDGVYDQAGAVVVVVRVEEGADDAATLSNIIGSSAQGTGVNVFLAAQSEVKVTPRVLIAPGWTSQRPDDAANPVVAELLGIASRLRAVIIADGPGTTDAAAITYREDWDSARVYIVDPMVKVWDTTLSANVDQPASARVAGVISALDNAKGFWWSPSNQTFNGVVGVSRAIQFGLSDSNCAANLLNASEVATIVHSDGYRLWGNRTTSTDSQWAFLSVRRTADMVYESIEKSFLWAMDRPMSANLIRDIQSGINVYLRNLKAKGGILGGTAYLDPELNTADQLKAGHLYVDYDLEPPAPMERLTQRAHRNDGYYDEMIAEVTGSDS